MMQFICGNAGSGKSAEVISRILRDLSDGHRVILIVPEQQAVESERAIIDAAGNLPTSNLEVLNFTRLANRVFRQYGGLSYNYIDHGARLLIMWRALASVAPMLSEYNSVSLTDRGLITTLTGAVKEFNSHRVTPSDMLRAADDVKVLNASLSRKLGDLAVITSAYDAILHDGYDDPLDDLTLLADILQDNNFFDGTNVYIDSFYSFTPQEYEIIRYIFKQADNVVISIGCLPSAYAPHFDTPLETLKRLRYLASRYIPANELLQDYILDEYKRFNNCELTFLADNIWNFQSSDVYSEKPEHISIIECGDIYSEAEAVAKDIMQKVRKGARYRDILVAARDLTVYYGVIDAVFEKYDIPYFLSVREDLSVKPLYKLILSALSIISRGWYHGDIITYLKTGLIGLTPDECDILESYVTMWNISGRRWTDEYDWNYNPDGYTDIVTELGNSIITKVNKLRLFVREPLMKFAEVFIKSKDGNDTDIRTASEGLYNFLVDLSIPEKISQTDEEEEAQIVKPTALFSDVWEDAAVWNSVINTLDQLVAVAGDMKVTADEYSRCFTLVVSETDLGRIPATIDEVLIGGAATLRSGLVKHCYILGVNEGLFPKIVTDDGFLSNLERAQLSEAAGIELFEGTDERSSNELFYFYNIAAAPSDNLTILYSNSDLVGKVQRPSTACERILQLFPSLKPVVYANRNLPELAEGMLASFEYVPQSRATPFGEALYSIYAENAEYAARLHSLEIPVTQLENKLSAETASAVFPGDLSLTQSRLDSYALCGFSYCCKYILKLAEQKKAVFRSVDVGNFIHNILERFFNRIYTPEGLDLTLTQEEIENLVDEIINDYILSIFGHNDRSSRLLQLVLRLRRTSFLLINNLLEEFSQSRFTPVFFELPIKFGDPEAVPPLRISLQDGSYAYIYGIVDRVDIYLDNDKLYLRVVDYKTGRKDFSLDDISLGINLQMLIYLFTMWHNGSARLDTILNHNIKPPELLPAGMLYFSARAPDLTAEYTDTSESLAAEVSSSINRFGLLLDDSNVLSAMEKNLAGQFIPVKVKKDGSFAANAPIISLESFGALMHKIEDIISKIGTEIKSGEASAKPLKTKRHDACAYCPMRPICRIQ